MISRRGKAEKSDWHLGSYVLLNDEPQGTAESRGKLNIPHQSKLYKIVDLNHDGFTCTIMDLLDGSRREVLQSRLMELSLETLEEYNFSTPNLWKNLQKLTDKSRNRYQAPSSRPSGLKLLKEGQAVPTLDNAQTEYQPEEREVANTPQEHGEVTNYIESPPLLFTNTDDVVNVHGDGQAHEDVGVEVNDEPTQLPSQDGPEKRVTRFKGLKHVPIYSTGIVKTLGNGQPKSILRGTFYKSLNNFQPDKLRIIPQDQFSARLAALTIHKEICTTSLCDICRLFGLVSKFKFNPGDYSRYVEKQALLHPLNTLKKVRSVPQVCFDVKTVSCKQKPYVGVAINLATIEQACRNNVSLIETNLIKTDSL